MATGSTTRSARGGRTPQALTGASTMYDRVTDRIRNEIMNGKLPAHARLKAPELAERLGVSPSPVREALQKLQAEGLILLRPNQGAVVKGLDSEEFVHAMRLRAAIEGMQAGLCATMGDASLIKKIKSAAEKFEAAVKSGEREKRVRANTLYHELIIGCDGSRIALDIVDRVQTITAAFRRQHPQTSSRFDRAISDHDALIEALGAGDAVRAEAVARAHVIGTMDDVLTVMRSRIDSANSD